MKNLGLRIRFEKRDPLHPLVRMLIPIASILIALLACGLMMHFLGYNATGAYRKLFQGSFGTFKNLSESTLQAIPLMLCSLGVAITFKMSLNNIGAEGQYMIGAFAATGVALYCPWIPVPLVLPAAIVAGFLAGGLWAALAVAPKALWGVNETIITLMFNYIALLFVDFWLYGSWRNTAGTNLPYSNPLPSYALLKTLGHTRITSAIFIALVAAVLIYVFFKMTSRGYQARVIGASSQAARYAGMDIAKNIFLMMICSGGLAGLAGATQVTGPIGMLQTNMAHGTGYSAIIIAYICKFNPFVILVASLLFGGLIQGGYGMQLVNVPEQIVTIIQGMILFFVLAGEIFSRNRLVLYRRARDDAEHFPAESEVAES